MQPLSSVRHDHAIDRLAPSHTRPEQTAIELFEAQVTLRPDAVALESETATLTYAELDRRAAGLAQLLQEAGLVRSAVAAIRLPASAEAVVAILAVLKCGATYLPLGPECPEKRVGQILQASGAKLLLTSRELTPEKSQALPIWYVDEHEQARGAPTAVARSGKDLAYVIYTSGTTGEPKGVMIENASLVNYLSWAAGEYLGPGVETFAFYTSISFDMTVTSILLPLISGNKLIAYTPHGNELVLERVLRDDRVTVLKLTPSHLRLIKDRDLSRSKVSKLIAGGEELGASLARDTLAAFGGHVVLYNEYGPTEATVGCMIYAYRGEPLEGSSVPIGVAIANTSIHLLDELLRPVEPDELGEIFIAGAGLSCGYLNRPDLTDNSFLPHYARPGEKMYRTGDLAIVGRDGQLIYKGRRDNQLKIRGFRIELDEIEQSILDYQKRVHKRSITRLAAPLSVDIRTVPRCSVCINRLDPSSADEMSRNICKTCQEYEGYREHADRYFRRPSELFELIKSDPSFGKNEYDAVLCFSGGKDSTYVLHKLAEQGIRLLAFTFDNGYISKGAFDNMRRAAEMLGVDLLIGDAKEMNAIFVDSLLNESNVCNGCFKSINTLALKLARKHGAKFVINGLSRGQIFDINVHGLFKLGIFDDAAIEERLQAYRKLYFSNANRISRLLSADIDERDVDATTFIDYFRYDDVVTRDVVEYITHERRAWVRPPDTGSSSSNCRLNDASIYFHVKNKGDHFYTSQLSWDVRLGTITREEAFKEIADFDLTEKTAQNVLHHIGFYKPNSGACVVPEKSDSFDGLELRAYVVADALTDFSELRAHLAASLPDYMVPSRFLAVDRLPLAASGKVDRKALAAAVVEAGAVRPEAPPSRSLTPLQEGVVGIWARVLGTTAENIGLESDFFELGGHSFKYVKMMSELKVTFGVVLSMNLTTRTTVATLSEQLEQALQTAGQGLEARPEVDHAARV